MLPTARIGFSVVPEFRIVLLSTVVVARLLMALPTMLMPVPAVSVAFDTSVKNAICCVVFVLSRNCRCVSVVVVDPSAERRGGRCCAAHGNVQRRVGGRALCQDLAARREGVAVGQVGLQQIGR